MSSDLILYRVHDILEIKVQASAPAVPSWLDIQRIVQAAVVEYELQKNTGSKPDANV